MDRTAVFNIAFEMWGILICLFAFAVIFLQKNNNRDKKNVSLCMEAACIILLVADMLSWYYQGRSGQTAYYMLKISNFGVFFVNYLYMTLFTFYLLVILNRGEIKMPARARGVVVLSAAGIVLLIISQFSDKLFYYIDGNNFYHRSSGYLLSQLIAVAGLVLSFSILLQYKKRLEKRVFWSSVLYFILPCISTVVVIFYYGISFQTISVVASTQIMFAVDMVEMDRSLARSRQEVERTKYEAEHDLLTGMYNKTAGMQRIREYIDNMTDEDSASLVFVDIDDFKSVNDTYGHAVGDYWIEMVAKFLRSDCYEEDVACRYGGDEYIVLHKGLSDISVLESKVIRFARKLQRKAMEKGQNVHCSAGICQINGSGFSTEECMNVADTALYEAKKKGKNASVIHSISRDGTDRVTVLDKIETDIKKAQSRVEARISYMYTDIIYVNYENNKYRVIKGDSELNNAVSCANNYDEVIGLISNRFESDRSRKIVRDFLSRERMESYTGGNMGYQTENLRRRVLSVSCANNHGGASLIHAVPVDEDGDRGYFVVVQDLDIYAG